MTFAPPTLVTLGHPEEVCGRCGGPNLWSWHAPSPLWNAVMRRADGTDEWQIVCPQCFAELAAAKGVIDAMTVWCLRPDSGVIVDLPSTDADGRRWDPERCLWRDAYEVPTIFEGTVG